MDTQERRALVQRIQGLVDQLADADVGHGQDTAICRAVKCLARSKPQDITDEAMDYGKCWDALEAVMLNVFKAHHPLSPKLLRHLGAKEWRADAVDWLGQSVTEILSHPQTRESNATSVRGNIKALRAAATSIAALADEVERMLATALDGGEP